MVALSELGDRICIMGPSNSGKSTLADAIARKIQTEVIHLDLLYHLPGTDWEPRADDEFHRLHDAAIASPRWVIEGNYSRLLPQRLARATGFILLDVPVPVSLFRYIRRSLLRRDRVGSLNEGKDRVKRDLLKHIAITAPKNMKRYVALYRTLELPRVHLATVKQIDACYSAWELTRFKSR